GRQDLAHLQALTAQHAHSERSQIHQAGERFQRQIAPQLGDQVGKHRVLWFAHRSLRRMGCSVCGYDRSQPLLRRLFPSACYRFFYCPLVRGQPVVLVDQREVLNMEVDVTFGREVTGTLRIGEHLVDLESVTAVYLRSYGLDQLPALRNLDRKSPQWLHAVNVTDTIAAWTA